MHKLNLWILSFIDNSRLAWFIIVNCGCMHVVHFEYYDAKKINYLQVIQLLIQLKSDLLWIQFQTEEAVCEQLLMVVVLVTGFMFSFY